MVHHWPFSLQLRFLPGVEELRICAVKGPYALSLPPRPSFLTGLTQTHILLCPVEARPPSSPHTLSVMLCGWDVVAPWECI